MDATVSFFSIPALGRLIRKKELSPVELTQVYLERIQQVDSRIHAFARVTSDAACARARLLEKEIMSGTIRGPLHGIPYAVKDAFAFPGYPTTWGSPAFADQVFDTSATVITKLDDAGAILLGKCAMTELAGSPSHVAREACRTPWDTARWAGGSSGGPAAAVASGCSAFALGTETLGCTVTPASYCGVSGLRPTYGRISRAGVMRLSWSMDTVGILTRTARDCATVFSALQGIDPADPSTIRKPFEPRFTRVRQRAPRLRVALINEDYPPWGDRDVQGAFREALAVLSSAGVHAEEIVLPDHPYKKIAETIITAEGASVFEPTVRTGTIGALVDGDRRAEILGGQLISAVDYLRCQRIRTAMIRDLSGIFRKYDILIGASALTCAPSVDADLKTSSGRVTTIGAAGNLVGLPAVSIPCGFNRDRLPVGTTVTGRPFGEAEVLEIAHLYQTITRWHEQTPPV